MSGPSRVALVTGSSRGIGADVALRLAHDGFRIIVNYAGRAEPAEQVAAQITEAGGEAIVIRADVSDPTAVIGMFEAAERSFGQVDVVVHCAGVLKLARLSEFDDATFDETIAVNLKGTFNVAREAARRVPDNGRIITFSSSVIGVRLPTYGVYIATKAAVEGMTQVLAQELRGRGISVNAVAPGPVATELFLTGKSDEQIEALAKMNPLERLGQPPDIAGIVAFLAGPDGAWINGQVIRANGGMC
jgi:3-oxoacyl-[acyl-carrier protein] reductase